MCCRVRCRATRSRDSQVLDVPTEFLRGNGDRETLEESPDRPSRIPESARQQLRWCRSQLDDSQLAAVAAWPAHVRLDVPGLGAVLFCHATPRNDEEVVTQLIPEDTAAAALRRRCRPRGVRPHPHAVRPYGRCHPGGECRQRRHALREARRLLAVARRRQGASCGARPTTSRRRLPTVRRTAFPDAEQFASVYILQPPDMLDTFTQYGLEGLKAAGHGA